MAKEDWVAIDKDGRPIGDLPLSRRTRARRSAGGETRTGKGVSESERRRLLEVESEERADAWVDGILRGADATEANAERRRETADMARFGVNTRVVADPVAIGRDTIVKVGDEPVTYGPGSPHSYFRDIAAARLEGMRLSVPSRDPALSIDATVRRLRRNDQEWSYTARHGTDEERGLVRRYYAEKYRSRHGTNLDQSARDYRAMLFDFEKRDASTAGGSMGDFAPNVYLLKMWQLYRTAAASFASQGAQHPLPATGMVVDVPVMTSPVTMSVQASENTSIAASSPTTTFAAAPVLTIAGGTTVSQQFVDRIGPGVEADEVIARQAARQAATTLDVQALTAVIAATGNTITNSGSPSITALWADIAKAAALIVDTEGTRLPVTTVHMPGANSKWFQSQVGTDGRPIWMPSPDSSALAGEADTTEEGFTGYSLLGGKVYENENMPTTGASPTYSTVLAGNPGIGLLVFSGVPIIDVFPGTDPAQLSVQINVRQYVALSVAYSSAFCAISGAAYPSSPTFTGS